jgi:hypoxia up-regulated 1
VEITGVSDALEQLVERGAIDPVVKATVRLSESGFVSVQDAVAYGEIKDDSIAGMRQISAPVHPSPLTITGKIKGLFSGGSSSSDEELQSFESVPPREPDVEASSSIPNASPSSEPVTEKKSPPKDLPKDLNQIPLNITVKFTSVPPMTVEEKRTARSRYLNLFFAFPAHII